MRRRREVRALAGILLLLGACGRAHETAGPPSDPEEAWMDGAQVRLAQDGCQETVTLVDVASGHEAVMSVESLAPDGGTECAGTVASATVALANRPGTRK